MRSRLLVAIIAIGIAISTAACTSEGPEPTPSASSRAVAPIKLTAANFVNMVTKAQSSKSAHIQMSIVADGQTINAHGDAQGSANLAQSEMALTMSTATIPNITLKLVGGFIYMDMGAQTQNKYVKIDPNDSSDPLAKSFSGVTGAADPSAAVAQLKGAITSVTVAGPDVTIDGVKTTPYAVMVNMAALGSTAANASLPAQAEFDYWLDANNRVRKVSSDVAGVSENIEFSNWGETVSVQAPSEDQITTVPGL